MAKPAVKRPKPRKKPAPSSRTPRVRIRMYRQGLGDCFLVTFDPDTKPYHILIDCGLISGVQAQPPDVMVQVAKDIRNTTNGRVDVLIATHEHWDHLSGFIQAREEFEKIDFGEIWFAWTEDPSDPLAQELAATKAALAAGFANLQKHLAMQQAQFAGDSPESLRLQGISDRVLGLSDFLGARDGGSLFTTKAALEYLRGRAGHRGPRYFRPGGEPVLLKPLGGDVRAYVLGPPYDTEGKYLKRTNPTKIDGKLDLSSLSSDLAFLAALGTLGIEASDRAQAFERHCRKTSDEASALYPNYSYPTESWRRVDHDWLSAADALALNLDNRTNNTSLVLAFELEVGGRILLFPGDAQVGNWESWHDHRWSSVRDDGKNVTAADLLARTVFYKVGHHASHNATRLHQGLEMMTHPDLVAFVPVNHKQAVKKRWNKMPSTPLLERIGERALGRIVRMDEGIPSTRPDACSPTRWQAFQSRLKETDLFIEYFID